MTPIKHCIEVSSEMLSFVGEGSLPRRAWPADAIAVSFAGLSGVPSPSLRFACEADDATHSDIVLVVQRAACRRIFGTVPEAGAWHLSSDLRAAALAILDCEAPAAARETLQLARSIELLCQVFAALDRGGLVPADGCADLCELDVARIAAACRLIDERWHEKLTLDGIARACGLNRDKLSRGFRSIYRVSVADRLAEKRLTGAHRLLQATDLPVSTIAYRCGYLNNASFTRAFARRFGAAPSLLRQRTIAA